jgi:hypothetical protein
MTTIYQDEAKAQIFTDGANNLFQVTGVDNLGLFQTVRGRQNITIIVDPVEDIL